MVLCGVVHVGFGMMGWNRAGQSGVRYPCKDVSTITHAARETPYQHQSAAIFSTTNDVLHPRRVSCSFFKRKRFLNERGSRSESSLPIDLSPCAFRVRLPDFTSGVNKRRPNGIGASNSQSGGRERE